MQPPPVVAGQLLQRTPSETDPALSKEDQVRRMFAPELEMEVRDKLCANIYGEDQLWEDLRREEQIDIDGKAELWARSDLNSVIDKVLEAEGRAKVAAQAAQKKSATAAQLHVYKWRCAVCGNSNFRKSRETSYAWGRTSYRTPTSPINSGPAAPSCKASTRSRADAPTDESIESLCLCRMMAFSSSAT